ncbi:MAG: hypothetical protein CL607_24215 [Anaerolineaceae bacterium]|nr:hypothetical protein [Anaerolineaceae bacterium]
MMSVQTKVTQLNTVEKNQERSFWNRMIKQILRDRLTLMALSILFLFTVASFFGPTIVENALHVDVEDASVRDRYLPPSSEHILGTDQLGRDQFIRLLYGGRISLLIAYSASLLAMTIGVSVGTLAGYFGGAIDDILTWVISTLSSIPSLFLLLIASAIFSPSPEVLVMILGFLSWIQIARLVRGQILSLKRQDFVLAAQALGSSDLRIMVYHILPNVISIALIAVTISAGNLILVESGLSFLGLGVQPPTPTWGNMLSDSRSYFSYGIHLVVWPGTMITLTVLCFFLLGDGLRDALDPRNRK